jgi:hypothetical protein
MSALIGLGGVVNVPHSTHGARHIPPRGACVSEGGAA